MRNRIEVARGVGRLASDTLQNQPAWVAFTDLDAKPGEWGLSGGRIHAEPGAISTPHRHVKRTSILYILQGLAATLAFTRGGAIPIFHGPGEFIRIPPGSDHCAVNLSRRGFVVAIEVSNEAQFNADVTLLPERAAEAIQIGQELQGLFSSGQLDVHPAWSERLTQDYWLQLSAEKQGK